MEPDADSSPDKFQRIVEATTASLAPVIKSIGLNGREADHALARDVRCCSFVTMPAVSVTRPISAASSQNAMGKPPTRATKPTPAGRPGCRHSRPS